MFRISKLTDYAIKILVEMALPDKQVCKAQSLAKSTQIPLPTVSKLLKLLANNGILSSYRGVNGGYKLAHLPEEISVYNIISALEGPIRLTECAVEELNSCSIEANCQIKQPWQVINKQISDSLKNLTLANISSFAEN